MSILPVAVNSKGTWDVGGEQSGERDYRKWSEDKRVELPPG